jgi:hypothetical protein
MEAGDFAQLLVDRLMLRIQQQEQSPSSSSSASPSPPLCPQALALALEEARGSSSSSSDPAASNLLLTLCPGRKAPLAANSSMGSSSPLDSTSSSSAAAATASALSLIPAPRLAALEAQIAAPDAALLSFRASALGPLGEVLQMSPGEPEGATAPLTLPY